MGCGEVSKRYYWLKLKKDFFKRHDIRIVESMPNGKDYILFYLKLLCESVDHEGNLRFSERIPYNEDMLATITNTNVDIVRNAIEIFTELNMMEIMDDGTIYMAEVNKMIGFETEWAEKKRIYREKQKQLEAPTEDIEMPTFETDRGHCPLDVLNMSDKSKSKSKSKSKNIIPNGIVDEIVNFYNENCFSMPKVEMLTDKRRDKVRARLKKFDETKIKDALVRGERSDFLTGRDGKWRGANFDWFFKNDENILKVLEGNYDNKGKVNSFVELARRLESEGK